MNPVEQFHTPPAVYSSDHLQFLMSKMKLRQMADMLFNNRFLIIITGPVPHPSIHAQSPDRTKLDKFIFAFVGYLLKQGNNQFQTYITLISSSKNMNFISSMGGYPCNYLRTPQIYTHPEQFMFNQGYLEQGIFLQEKLNSETAFLELQQKYRQLLQDYNSVKGKLEQIMNKQPTSAQKRKFIRRKEDQLEKKHLCCYDNCKKEYASVLALNLHIKTKHHGGTKKQRDDRAIILAEQQGKPIPKDGINLPAGYLETYRLGHKNLRETAPEAQSHSD